MTTKNANKIKELALPISNSRTFFKLKQLEGDQGIWLGQSILALITLNQSPAYSDEMNKGFTVGLITSLMEELGITPEDIQKEIANRENTDED